MDSTVASPFKIGIADTTFSRVDTAAFALDVIQEANGGSSGEDVKYDVERYTVPGFKDLPVACKKLIEEHNCDIVIAMGMVGKEPIDKQCGHEASLGLGQVQLMTNTHVIEIFVHEDEGEDDADLYSIFKNRTIKHTHNALALLQGKETLTPFAGSGRRQGREDVGLLPTTSGDE